MNSKFKVFVMLTLALGLMMASCAAPAAPAPAPAEEAPAAPAAAEEAAPAVEEEAPAEEAGILRMLTWEGYAPDSLVTKFTEETGIEVEISYIGDNNELIAKMAGTHGVGYDLVSPTLSYVATAQDEHGIYMPIDLSKVQTDQIQKANLDSILENSKYEGESYALPFVWGTTAMIVNTELAPDAGATYLDLCDAQYEGRISYRSKYDTLYMFSYALGNDPAVAVKDEAEYRAVMEETLEKLIECKPLVRTYWESRQQMEELMTTEEIWISSSWDAAAWQLSLTDPKFKYVVPAEGAVGWFDTLAISAGAENVDAAYAWINFILNPENSAVIISDTGYQTASEGAAALASSEMAALVAESLPAEKMANINWYFPKPAYAADIEADVEEQLKAAK